MFWWPWLDTLDAWAVSPIGETVLLLLWVLGTTALAWLIVRNLWEAWWG